MSEVIVINSTNILSGLILSVIVTAILNKLKTGKKKRYIVHFLFVVSGLVARYNPNPTPNISGGYLLGLFIIWLFTGARKSIADLASSYGKPK
jgi:hypothetical protein